MRGSGGGDTDDGDGEFVECGDGGGDCAVRIGEAMRAWGDARERMESRSGQEGSLMTRGGLKMHRCYGRSAGAASPQQPDYFRRDQDRGVTAPDLSKDCAHSEHVVRARGKRTRLTSVSLDPAKIDDFGPALYVVLRPGLAGDGHSIIDNHDLLASLKQSAASTNKADRVRALQAMRYAARRHEGLIDWKFDVSGVDRKDLICWAFSQIQKYFQRR